MGHTTNKCMELEDKYLDVIQYKDSQLNLEKALALVDEKEK